MDYLNEYFNELVKRVTKNENYYLAIGTVVSVKDFVVTYINSKESDKLEFEANLSPIGANTEGIIQIPKEGSKIIVGYTNKNDAFVLYVEKADKIYINAETEIVYNGGAEFMTNATELKTQLDKLTGRVDGIIDAIKNGVPIPQDGGTGLQATIVAALNLLTDKETFANIKDEKIKH